MWATTMNNGRLFMQHDAHSTYLRHSSSSWLRVCVSGKNRVKGGGPFAICQNQDSFLASCSECRVCKTNSALHFRFLMLSQNPLEDLVATVCLSL